MHELDRIRLALTDAAGRGESAVLATVVSVDGSAYRGAGARMVVRADGSTVGAVSGGCLEADIVARAAEVLASGTPANVHYDTRSSDDGVFGLGLGCQGVVDVRLEPLAGDALRTEIDRLAELRARNAVRLLVCGAGADAIPVVRLAAMTGWLVTVVDHRPSFATAERFPDAERVIHLDASQPEGALASAVRLDDFAAAVVMGHAAAHDRAPARAARRRRPALPRRARTAPAHARAARGRTGCRGRRRPASRLRARRTRPRRRDAGRDRARDRERVRDGARRAHAEVAARFAGADS